MNTYRVAIFIEDPKDAENAIAFVSDTVRAEDSSSADSQLTYVWNALAPAYDSNVTAVLQVLEDGIWEEA